MNWQIATGRLKIPQNLLTRLADTYKVNLYWFLTGNDMIEESGIFVVSIGNTLVVKRIDRGIASQTIGIAQRKPGLRTPPLPRPGGGGHQQDSRAGSGLLSQGVIRWGIFII
jgi:hypothetical protein